MFQTGSVSQIEILRRFSATRQQFGMVRIESGVLLYLIKRHGLWKGRAETFGKFLSSHQLSVSGANQFIKVAQKFYFELGVRDERLVTLARCSMSMLLKAVEKVNANNLDRVLTILETLNEDDIRIELEAIEEGAEKIFKPLERSEKLVEARALISTMNTEELIALRNELWTKTRAS